MSQPKDRWDKFEIFGKVALPIVVALAAVFLNNQISVRQIHSEKTALAVRVLSSPADPSRSTIDPIREWAVDVLESDYDFALAALNELLTGTTLLPFVTVSGTDDYWLYPWEETENPYSNLRPGSFNACVSILREMDTVLDAPASCSALYPH